MAGGRHASPRVLRGPAAASTPTRLWRTALVTALVLLLVVLAAPATGHRLLVVRSGSMSPTLLPGDLVVSRSCPAATLAPGRIVTFSAPGLGGDLVTHRVVDVQRTGDTVAVETRGDANSGSEHWQVPASATLGCHVADLAGPARALPAAWVPWLPVAGVGVLLTLVVAGAATLVLRRVWLP